MADSELNRLVVAPNSNNYISHLNTMEDFSSLIAINFDNDMWFGNESLVNAPEQKSIPAVVDTSYLEAPSNSNAQHPNCLQNCTANIDTGSEIDDIPDFGIDLEKYLLSSDVSVDANTMGKRPENTGQNQTFNSIDVEIHEIGSSNKQQEVGQTIQDVGLEQKSKSPNVLLPRADTFSPWKKQSSPQNLERSSDTFRHEKSGYADLNLKRKYPGHQTSTKLSQDDEEEKIKLKRSKNNEAAKRCRDKKKALKKHNEELERNNDKHMEEIAKLEADLETVQQFAKKLKLQDAVSVPGHNAVNLAFSSETRTSYVFGAGYPSSSSAVAAHNNSPWEASPDSFSNTKEDELADIFRKHR